RGPAERRQPRMRAALAALIVSLLAKAWGMTLPLVLLVIDAYPLRRLRRGTVRALLIEKIPFAVVALAGGAVAFLAQHSVEEMRTLSERALAARIAQAAYGLCFYVWKT